MSNAEIPKASVILPVYNGGKYLRDAIDSVLQQTFRDFELLLLDDGSTDGSLDILNEYAQKDSRCRVITRGNKGLVYTLNEGVALARGSVLIRMDADDLCMPQRFSMQMDYLNKHPKCIAVGSRVLLIDPEGDPLRPFVDALDHKSIDDAHMSGRGGTISHPAVAMRRHSVLSVGGYRSDFKHAEDLDLFLRLAEYGELSNLPEQLLQYRQHPGSIGYKYRSEQIESAIRAIKDARARRNLPTANLSGSITSPEQETQAMICRRWAWWALGAGNIQTARKYAKKVLKLEPLRLESWKVFLCVMRGY